MKTLAALAAALAAAAILAPASAHAGVNLLTNGGFETGDFTAWDEFDIYDFTFVQSGDFDSLAPRGGQYQALLGAVRNGELSQDLETPVGATYRLSFDLANEQAGENGFFVGFGAQHDFVCLHCDAFGYRRFSYDTQSLFPFSEVVFDFFNAPSYFHLDNVSVIRLPNGVPEPGPWALMIVGFGAAGAMLRRNRVVRAA